ncbi:MAG: MMPL family transporter, partial [Firmicutes bacterium]|nr:MMPL family transporter [Bacillota bacterium]
MLKFGQKVTKHRRIILIVALLLVIPSIFGFIGTRVNFDVLTYLPDSIETIKGQDILLDEFGKGGYGLITVEGMDYKDVAKMKEKMEKVDNVESVLWFDTVADISVPREILPDSLTSAFNSDDATMMAIFFGAGTSDDDSLAAMKELRQICGQQCYISSMTAFVEDLKELTDHEMPIYVILAVVLSSIILGFFMDSWILPLIFISGIGMEILYNMGTNIFKGEISYITMAVAAVLQLGVTMDYSIFLWHSYKEQKEERGLKREEAMSQAIAQTLTSIAGSSITTIAGFLALCFMTFTLGIDLGVVMAKGVVFGIIGSVTILPALILGLEKYIEKFSHRSFIPKFGKLSHFLVNNPKKMLVLFVILLIPSIYGYLNTDQYYKLDESVPQDLPFAIANQKVEEEFGIATSYMIMADADTSAKDITNMVKDIKEVDGVDQCLGLKSMTGDIPSIMIPDEISSLIQNDNWQVLMVTSKYAVASDEVNVQVDEINAVMDKYDEKAMLIGEAPCTKDLIDITDHDFKVVDFASIFAILLIIMVVLRSFSLPVILVAVIELAIFINLGIPCFTGTKLAFIAGIIISTVQLGSTVDYAILMTTRYKTERIAGHDAKEAVRLAHSISMPSIMVSAFAFAAATLGVGIYSEVDLIGSLCTLMARGALISMIIVMLFLPTALVNFDKLIIGTTGGMKKSRNGENEEFAQDLEGGSTDE